MVYVHHHPALPQKRKENVSIFFLPGDYLN